MLIAKWRGAIDWHPSRNVISILCKGYYLAHMAVFWARSMPGMICALNVWIIDDRLCR